MPKVTINEIDQSRYVVNSQRAPLIALTPVIASWGATDSAVLIQSESDYRNYFGTPLVDAVEGDITRNYALNLINSGVSLLAKRIKPDETRNSESQSIKTLDDLYAQMDIDVNTQTASYNGWAVTNDNPSEMYVEDESETATTKYICISTSDGTTIPLPKHHEALASDNGALKVVPNDTEDYEIVQSGVEGALEVMASVLLGDVTVVAPELEVNVGDYVKMEGDTFVIAEQGDEGALEVVEALAVGTVSIYTVKTETPSLNVTVGQYVKLVDSFDPETEIHVGDVDLGAITPEINSYVVTYDTYITNEIDNGGLVRYSKEIVEPKFVFGAKAKYFGTYGNKVALKVTKANTNDNDVLSKEPKKTVTFSTYVVTLRTDAETPVNNVINRNSIKSTKLIDSVTLRYDTFKEEDSLNRLDNYLDEFSMLSDITIKNYVPAGEDDKPMTEADYVEFVETITANYADDFFILTDGADFFTETEDFTPEFTGSDTIKQFYKTLIETESGSTIADVETINEFWDDFKDPYIYDFDFICASGFTNLLREPINVTDSDIRVLHANMLKLASYRGDAVACLDCPKEYDHKQLLDYFKNLSNSDTSYSYGTTHGPWCKIRDITTGNYLLMPGSFIFLATIGTNLARNGESQIWYAPAGVARASTNLVVAPQYEIGATVLNEWQNDNEVRINPIMKILTYGYTIYGNATLMQDEEGYTKSALQSLGTRVLCNVVKKAIFSICVGLTFEPNDYILWAEFKTRLSTTLDQMKVNGGIADYQIVMDESTVTDEAKNNLTVPGKVFISPTRPAEFFDIDFTITQAGVTFDESKSDVIG